MEGVRETNRTKSVKSDKDKMKKMEELKKALRRMTNRKSPGHDKITAENFRRWWNVCTLGLINKAWANKNNTKNVWKVGMILPIHKKGDPNICSNCRRIILLTMSLKLYEQILDDKLQSMYII